MKFIIEQLDEKDESQLRLHFDRPIIGFMPRLCKTVESTQQVPGPMPMIARMTQCIPHETLVGIEAIRPASRYAIDILFGKCFPIQECLDCLMDHLEIEFVQEEWNDWIVKLEQQINQGLTFQDQTSKEIEKIF